MRRRAGSWKFGRTAEHPVEVARHHGASPRPGARLHGIAALIAMVHAVLIAAAWQMAPVRERIGERRLSMRLVPSAPARQVVATAPSEVSTAAKATAARPERSMPRVTAPAAIE